MKNKLAILLLLAAAVAGCKKDSNSLTGRWKLEKTQYTFTTDSQQLIRDTVVFDTQGQGYIQFNSDGSGSTNVAEHGPTKDGYTDVTVQGAFKYKVSAQTLSCTYSRSPYPLVRTITINGTRELILTLKAKQSEFAMSLPSTENITITEYYSK